MPTIDIPGPIRRYFELAAHPDQAAYVDQFAADALVEDEGRNYQGIDAIRSWRGEVPLVTYTIKSMRRNGQDARVEIAGDFPGSPVELAFHFEFDPAGKLQLLTIRP
ncbi:MULTISPECIES: nuclear transport factor 2 family protein [unclassified Frankia]|uniref:nuclear transport factor 2 family protein n=1 Tax=unclassified Frankia TaxID=2632575 RepID=UPI001EF4B675|nr:MULTISPECIES: nuclear transport factor 2 family protein [unclassified Frankia]